MQDTHSERDFLYVQDTVSRVRQTLKNEPFSQFSGDTLIQFYLTGLQKSLNFRRFPDEEDVGSLSRTLRKEKFRFVREEGRQSRSAAEIQALIDSLKDLRQLLLLTAQSGGVTSRSGPDAKRPGDQVGLFVMGVALALMVAALVFFGGQGDSRSSVFASCAFSSACFSYFPEGVAQATVLFWTGLFTLMALVTLPGA